MRPAPTLRWFLAGLFYFGFAGTVAELWLLEHYETFAQWSPFLVLVAAAAALAWALIRPDRWALLATRATTLAVAVVGAIGVYLHYRGNAAFELEMDPDMQGLALAWAALKGATPSLAPGLMVQLGLIGLAFTYRHPGLHAGAPQTEESHEEMPE